MIRVYLVDVDEVEHEVLISNVERSKYTTRVEIKPVIRTVKGIVQVHFRGRDGRKTLRVLEAEDTALYLLAIGDTHSFNFSPLVWDSMNVDSVL